MLKFDRSMKLYERACQSLATGVSSGFRRHVTPVPLYVQRGQGPYFYDADGQEWLDYNLAFGPLILGNNHPKLNEAISRQLESGYTYGTQHAGEIELAELMLASIPKIERVIFANTGSEAVQTALRLARAYTGRTGFVKFEGHYNGWHNNLLVSVHPPADALGSATATCGGQPAAEYGLTRVVPWNDLDTLKRTFEQHPDQIAAVITEPILVNGGACMPDDGYLAGLIDLCHQYGAVSIFDEVITGFRVALGGARQYFGLEPDLCTYAKAIAAGFSFAAVAGRKAIFDILDDERTVHYGTYNGNPISVAAAIATIRILAEPGTYQRMHAHGDAICQAMQEAAATCGHQVVTSGVGPAFCIHFGLAQPPRSWNEVLKANQALGQRFNTAMLAQGIYLGLGGRWYVGAAHGDRELERVTSAIHAAMKQVN